MTRAAAIALSSSLLCIALFCVAASGEEAEERLSLREAVLESLRQNNYIRAGTWSVESKRDEKGIATSALLPKVTFEERFTRTNNPTYAFMSKLNQERFSQEDFAIGSLNDPDEINNYQTMVMVEQPVFVKKAYVARDMADRAVVTSEFELRRTKERVVFDLFRAYVGIMVAKEFEEVAHKGLDDAREHLRIAEVRSDSGLGLYSDVLRASVAVAQAERAVVTAEKELKVAKRMFGVLMGKSEPFDIVDNGLPAITLAAIDEYREASLSRADLKAMELRRDNAGAAVRLADADYFPSIGVGGSYQFDDHGAPFGSEGESWQVMAFLRVNIFDGLQREYSRSRAIQQEREAGEYLAGLRKQIDFEIYEAYYSVLEAEKKYALAETAETAAGESARHVSRRYENSLAPLVSLLDAQTALDKSRADVVAMRGEYLIALARLEFVSGRMLRVLGLGGDLAHSISE